MSLLLLFGGVAVADKTQETEVTTYAVSQVSTNLVVSRVLPTTVYTAAVGLKTAEVLYMHVVGAEKQAYQFAFQDISLVSWRTCGAETKAFSTSWQAFTALATRVQPTDVTPYTMLLWDATLTKAGNQELTAETKVFTVSVPATTLTYTRIYILATETVSYTWASYGIEFKYDRMVTAYERPYFFSFPSTTLSKWVPEIPVLIDQVVFGIGTSPVGLIADRLTSADFRSYTWASYGIAFNWDHVLGAVLRAFYLDTVRSLSTIKIYRNYFPQGLRVYGEMRTRVISEERTRVYGEPRLEEEAEPIPHLYAEPRTRVS